MITATAAQVRYAAKLQAELRERITWTVDRDTLAAALRPQSAGLYASPEERAAARAAIATYNPDAAIDAWITRRADLADTDLATLDGPAMSEWIDAAKRAL